MLKNELEVAIKLARQAGTSILGYCSSGFVTEEKIGADNFSEPVTIADRTASEIIVAGLSSAFPDDGILSEELPDNDERLTKERVWIIDPLDGTKGFIEGNGDFAVQIGLAIGGQSVLGVVHLPYYDSLYFATKGCGAFQIKDELDASRLRCESKASLSEMTIAVSRHHPSAKMIGIIKEFGIERKVERGSVGLKVGLITDHICDLYIHFSPRTKHWDTCAPEIIIKEAGGNLTDLFGRNILYNTPDVQNHNGVLASSGVDVHENLVNRMREKLREFGRVRI
jgi:3'(2'), 5'-bisphosphate nucleotidase